MKKEVNRKYYCDVIKKESSDISFDPFPRMMHTTYYYGVVYMDVDVTVTPKFLWWELKPQTFHKTIEIYRTRGNVSPEPYGEQYALMQVQYVVDILNEPDDLNFYGVIHDKWGYKKIDDTKDYIDCTNKYLHEWDKEVADKFIPNKEEYMKEIISLGKTYQKYFKEKSNSKNNDRKITA